jgi:hypothetical protein
MIRHLEAARREMYATGLELKHVGWILDELRKALIAKGRMDLVEVPDEIMLELNNVARDAPSLLFRKGGRGWPTPKVNLVWLALEAVRQAMALTPPMSEADAALLVLPIVQRQLPDTTAATITNWRGELQRKTGRSTLPAAVAERYRKGLPPNYGDTPKARLENLLGVLNRSIRESPPASQTY